MIDIPPWRPPCYAPESRDRLESALVRMGLAGPIVEPVAFDNDPWEANPFYIAADAIQAVIHRREAQDALPGPIRLVYVDHPARAARIGLIAITVPLLLDLQAFALRVAESEAAAAIFNLTRYFADGDGPPFGGAWERRSVANGLLQTMLAILVNHEIAHINLGHFEVLGEAMEAFAEDTTDEDAEDAFTRQVLEIDADSFAISRTFQDILAGAYPTTFAMMLLPEGWRAGLVLQESDSATRLATLANLLLWTFLDGRYTDAPRWTARHPPPLFRCLAAIRVIGGDVARLHKTLHRGQPVVDSEQCETGYERAVEAFKAIMRELGSPASAQLTNIYQQHMEAHTERLRPVWDSIKVDLPAYRDTTAQGT